MAGAAQVSAGRQAGQSAVLARSEAPGRPWRDRVSTPGRIRWMLGWLVAGTLAWGALAAFTVSQHASGAGAVVTSSEPLAYDGLQAWQSLSDANDEASAAILAGSLPPQAIVARYQHDLDVARGDIVDAARHGGPAGDLNALSTGLDRYQDEVAGAGEQPAGLPRWRGVPAAGLGPDYRHPPPGRP
jgi:hypothetical protein